MSSAAPEESPTVPVRRLRYPAIVELIILAGLVILLMIGLFLIQSTVWERTRRAQSVRSEIASSWAQNQMIIGPALIVPYRVGYFDNNGKPVYSFDHARFLPTTLKTTGRLFPERRHRGIFDTVVYRCELTIDGTFARPDFAAWSVRPEDILWNEAVITIGISDLRGIRGNPLLQWNGAGAAFSGGSADTKLFASGLTAAVPTNRESPQQIPFHVTLPLNGSENITFVPLGGETIVELQSSWPHPSFTGAFLPDSRTVSAHGFTAKWNISSLARSYPQKWTDNASESVPQQVLASAFGVGLFTPVSHYQKTERSMKYGALFIILTFLTFFLYELLSPVTLHPVQYFLAGGALCLFYLLLLSISEHARFSVAYAVASIATVTLISVYSRAIPHSVLRVFGLAGVLSLLYAYLYVLLQLEDWALLMGSVGLFLILALVMYTTRRVDWGSAHLAGQTP